MRRRYPDFRLLIDQLIVNETVIQCAGVDILRDEAFAYAEALEADGVDVEIFGYQGLPHCFPVMLETIPETSEFYRRYQNFLGRYATTSSVDK